MYIRTGTAILRLLLALVFDSISLFQVTATQGGGKKRVNNHLSYL